MLRRVPASKTLCAFLLVAVLLLLGVSSAQAAPSPDSVVEGFYRTYTQQINANNGEHWVERLVKAQRAHLDPALAARLLEIAGNPPGTDKPWLDFDPFSNSQMGTRRYEVLRAVAVRNGTCLVPVALRCGCSHSPQRRTSSGAGDLHSDQPALRIAGALLVAHLGVYPPRPPWPPTRHGCPPAPGRAGRVDAEMGEDAADVARVHDGCHHVGLTAASWAPQHVTAKRPSIRSSRASRQ